MTPSGLRFVIFACLLGWSACSRPHEPLAPGAPGGAAKARTTAAPTASKATSKTTEEANDVEETTADEATAEATSAATSVAAGTPSDQAPEDTSSKQDSSTPPVSDPLLESSGRPLPQTKAKPTLDSAHFQREARRLFEAIVKDDASLAARFFFPEIAYTQVKDIPDPSSDWKTRLYAAYEKDIHAYHRALGKFRSEATFDELRVAEELARWVTPGEEVNREGYFRVMRSVLVYRDHEGKKRELGVRTMISWRGEWYVVHLK